MENCCANWVQKQQPDEKTQSQHRREDKQVIKKLERELNRKEKALAETAALLVLSKKWEAIWGENEED